MDLATTTRWSAFTTKNQSTCTRCPNYFTKTTPLTPQDYKRTASKANDQSLSSPCRNPTQASWSSTTAMRIIKFASTITPCVDPTLITPRTQSALKCARNARLMPIVRSVSMTHVSSATQGSISTPPKSVNNVHKPLMVVPPALRMARLVTAVIPNSMRKTPLIMSVSVSRALSGMLRPKHVFNVKPRLPSVLHAILFKILLTNVLRAQMASIEFQVTIKRVVFATNFISKVFRKSASCVIHTRSARSALPRTNVNNVI